MFLLLTDVKNLKDTWIDMDMQMHPYTYTPYAFIPIKA